MHCVARQNKLEKPKEKDVVNCYSLSKQFIFFKKNAGAQVVRVYSKLKGKTAIAP
jgi:hypothetical protein